MKERHKVMGRWRVKEEKEMELERHREMGK